MESTLFEEYWGFAGGACRVSEDEWLRLFSPLSPGFSDDGGFNSTMGCNDEIKYGSLET